MEVLDIVLKYASIGMLGLLGIFIVIGMFSGMIRGFKRSALRLAIYVGMLVAVFLLTPLVTNAILGIKVGIFGYTPRGWVDFLSDKLVVFLKNQLGSYITPFGSYVTELSLGLVLAVVNVVIFFAMYFIMKFVSWIVYSVVAHFVAPKKDRNGKKYPKNVLGGALFGALQGVALFLFFMLPINGLLGVVHQAVQYQVSNEVATVQTQSVSTDADNSTNSSDIQIEKIMHDVDQSLSMYHNIMKFTGLQFLSDRAFEYQLTVRIEGAGEVNLVHDIDTAWELYIDAKAATPVLDKVVDMFETQNYTLLTSKDYQVLRNITNKAFNLELLKLADWFLADLDKVLATPFDEEDLSYLEGTEIYKNSIYGVLVEQMTTNREVEVGANNYNKFADSLSAVVNFVAEQKLGLVKNDLLNIIDLFANLNTYKVRYYGNIKTVAAVLSEEGLSWRDYLNLATARLAVANGDYAVGAPVMDVFGSHLNRFSLVKMLGLTNMENLIVYSNFCDNLGDDDLENLIYGMAESFLGDKAFTKGEVQGSWARLGDIAFDFAEVINENDVLINDLSSIMTSENPQVQTLIGKIGELIITKEYFDAHPDEFVGQEYGDAIKYQKVDTLVNGIHKAINAFEPIKTFLTAQLNKMGEDNELFEMIQNLMNASVEEWRNKFHSLVSAANLMNNEAMTDIMDKLENNAGELATEDIVKVLDVIQKEMDAETVTEIIDTVITMPEVGDSMKESINDALAEILPETEGETSEVLKEIFETEAESAQASLETLQQYLNNETDIETGEPIVDQKTFQGAIDDLLKLVRDTDLSAWLGSIPL